jgi:hypothetical protein
METSVHPNLLTMALTFTTWVQNFEPTGLVC